MRAHLQKQTMTAAPSSVPHGKRPFLLGKPLPNSSYIAGEWSQSGTGSLRDVIDPSDGSRIGQVPASDRSDVCRAVCAATAAFAKWRLLLALERAAVLKRWSALMHEHAEDLAVILTLEQGKPLAESRGEIRYATSFLDWFAEEAVRAYGMTIPSHLHNSVLTTWREPVGVVGAITPWNFPSAMITRKAGAALAAGCTVIVHPAEETPYSAIALAVLAEKAGVPPGVFSVVTGDPRVFSEVVMQSEAVRQISFTGSTGIGRLLMSQAASSVKRVSLELGGHAPFLVFEDADLDSAVRGCVAAKFATTGQDCLAANRILVASSRYQEFCERFTARVRSLQVGSGFEAGVEIGPLINERAVEKCQRHVDDAVSKGATILCGGKRHARGGTFFEPTVMSGIGPSMAIYSEETFGPIAPISSFNAESEAIQLANDSIYGLAAYVYTRDCARALRVAGALEYGMVMVNTAKMTGAPVPFGGVKQSGIGREGSHFGMDEYTSTKSVCLSTAAN